MTDVAPPLAGPARTVSEEALSPDGAALALSDYAAPISFPELVLAHHDWRLAVADHRPSVELERAYCRKLIRFEAEHGRIINAYWCLTVPSAVALTAKPHARSLRWLGHRRTLAFHRVTDWATRGRPEIAASLHRCDEIAIRAGQVLTGLRERVALQLVMASAAHLLSLADERATHSDRKEALEQETRNLDKTEAYYCDAANGQAQMTYFAGMAVFAVLLGLLALLNAVVDPLPNVDDREFFGALFAGALGAVVSVVQRINSGRFDLEYDVGRPYAFFLGGLRPLMGGVFGLVFYFAVSSGLLDVVPIAAEGTDRFYALVVLAFVAGFSERWAKDTLASAAGARPTGEVRTIVVNETGQGASNRRNELPPASTQ
jgi:hypothetical protein